MAQASVDVAEAKLSTANEKIEGLRRELTHQQVRVLELRGRSNLRGIFGMSESLHADLG